MGDHVSISFKNQDEESVVLFDHWGGMYRVEHAREYVLALQHEVANHQTTPLDRLEPGTVMVDYIRDITALQPRIRSSLYLGATAADGDNSDNGHHVIYLHKN